jgi:hypothetical protein
LGGGKWAFAFDFPLQPLQPLQLPQSMIEIFKTNVSNKKLAGLILKALQRQLPAYTFNFDLEDCDRILRVQTQGADIAISAILNVVKNCGAEIQLFAD